MTIGTRIETRIDEATLSVMLDVKHPFAYLALEPAIAFGKQRGIEINWLPLEVPALNAPSEPGAADDRGIRHRRSRARMIAREIETYAAAAGLVLCDAYRAAPTPAIDLGWLYLREHDSGLLEAFLREAFRAYWAVEIDPADLDSVASLVERLAPSADAHADGLRKWASDGGAVVLQAVGSDLNARGFTGVPGYYLPKEGSGEFFQGRQHLPMIGWLLDGRTGPGPI